MPTFVRNLLAAAAGLAGVVGLLYRLAVREQRRLDDAFEAALTEALDDIPDAAWEQLLTTGSAHLTWDPVTGGFEVYEPSAEEIAELEALIEQFVEEPLGEQIARQAQEFFEDLEWDGDDYGAQFYEWPWDEEEL